MRPLTLLWVLEFCLDVALNVPSNHLSDRANSGSPTMQAPSEKFHGRHCRQWDLLLKRLPVDTTISNSIFAYLSHAPLYFGNCGAVRRLWIVFLSTIHLVCGMKVMDLLANNIVNWSRQVKVTMVNVTLPVHLQYHLQFHCALSWTFVIRLFVSANFNSGVIGAASLLVAFFIHCQWQHDQSIHNRAIRWVYFQSICYS